MTEKAILPGAGRYQQLDAQRLLSAILSSLDIGILMVDRDLNIVAFNDSAEAITGRSRADVVNRPCRRILGSDRCATDCPLRRTIETGDSISRDDVVFEKKSGEKTHLSITTFPITSGNNEITGALEVFRDVSRLMAIQTDLLQAEKLASLGFLAAGVAHEVNNPLTGVIVYLKLLLKKFDEGRLQEDETRSQLLKMESEIRRCSGIIRNLLDFARQSEPTIRPVNVNTLVQETMQMVRNQARIEDITVTSNLDVGLRSVAADPDQLRQVFLNILLNAVHAMPEGGELRVVTSSVENFAFRDGPSRAVSVEISDTGCGIPAEDLDKIFTPFYTTKQKGKGVGLGLAVVYGIVSNHGGRIKVESEAGVGTTFSVYLKDEPQDKA
jgi:PAS domain S-box-containing protein